MLFIFWRKYFAESLSYREQLQLFENTWIYFRKHLLFQGGLVVYLSEFFIQFFKFSILGVLIASALLMCLYYATFSFLEQVSTNRLNILFSFLPVFAYTLLLTNELYSLAGVFAFIITLLFARLFVCIKNFKKRYLAGIVLIILLYWFAGGAFIILGLLMVLSELIKSDKNALGRNLIFSVLLLSGMILIPLFARQFLFHDTLLQSYLSSAYYKVPVLFPLELKIVFLLFPAIVILSYLTKKLKLLSDSFKSLSSLILVLLVWCVLILATSHSETEIARYYGNMVYTENWDEIIAEAENGFPDNDEIHLAINLALAKQGKLTSHFFSIDNLKPVFHLPYQRRGMTPLIASDPYYHAGLINFSQMYAAESVSSTIDQKMPVRSAIRLAQTYVLNGQFSIAEKYLNKLKNSLFYRKWAKQTLQLIAAGEEELLKYDEWNTKKQFMLKEDFYYNKDQLHLAMIFLLRSNQSNHFAFEYLMLHLLLEKDFDSFLNYLRYYRNMEYVETPLYFEQALAYIETLRPGIIDAYSFVEVSESTIQHIQRYAMLYHTNNENDREKLKAEYANTYWYYLHFK